MSIDPVPSTSSAHNDVLIIGAGPVGLLLAILLRRQGVKQVSVVDRQPSRYPLPRAVCLDHESQRTLWSAGLGEDLEPLLENIVGAPTTNFAWRDADGEMIVDLYWERPTQSGWNRASGFSQPQLEKVLEEAAIKNGVQIIRGYELKSLEQNETTVSAALQTWPTPKEGPTPLHLTASYLVGADGANSTVRALCNIDFHDLGFQYDWLVCDMLTKPGISLPERAEKFKNGSQVCDPKRPTTLAMAGPGRKRIEFMRLPTETVEEIYNKEAAWRLIADWGYTTDHVELERIAMYTFRARWAESWRHGRIFLAGDGAHQMPPFIGQGMNSGLRDAVGLSWRLPLALRGGISERLLDSYTTERLSHVKALTNHCIVLGKLICETNPDKAARQHADLRANPPPHGFDPLLGQPGLLTNQSYAGSLSLQRPVRSASHSKSALFDEVHGAGWRLVTLLPHQPRLSASSRDFFEGQLGGKVIALGGEDGADVTGEYAQWFKDELEGVQAVVWRPDHYVFGGAKDEAECEALIETLRAMVMA